MIWIYLRILAGLILIVVCPLLYKERVAKHWGTMGGLVGISLVLDGLIWYIHEELGEVQEIAGAHDYSLVVDLIRIIVLITAFGLLYKAMLGEVFVSRIKSVTTGLMFPLILMFYSGTFRPLQDEGFGIEGIIHLMTDSIAFGILLLLGVLVLRLSMQQRVQRKGGTTFWSYQIVFLASLIFALFSNLLLIIVEVVFSEAAEPIIQETGSIVMLLVAFVYVLMVLDFRKKVVPLLRGL